MGTHSIEIGLTSDGVSNAIAQFTKYVKWVDEKTAELTKRVTLLGLDVADIRFSSALYDGTNDVSVKVEEAKNGVSIVAQGKAVCFIEFGSGVFYNGAESYSGIRPDGVVGIGEYGHHRGRNDSWYYKDASGNAVKTHGNPPAAAMFFASQTMQQRFLGIAKEVFG